MPENAETFSINALSTRLGYDRRSLSKWLRDVQPAGEQNGFPVYRLADAQAAISKALQKTKRGSAARERLVNLQADKLAFQIACLKREYIRVEDVERDVGEMIAEARRVLEPGSVFLAPQVVGVSIAEAEELIRQWLWNAMNELHNWGKADETPPTEPAQQPTIIVETPEINACQPLQTALS